jgi:hypothetical protein
VPDAGSRHLRVIVRRTAGLSGRQPNSDCKSVTSSATVGRTHLCGRWSRYKEILMAIVNADIIPANTLGTACPRNRRTETASTRRR